MGFRRNSDDKITFKVGDIDEVVDCKGNSVIMLRKVAWNGGNEKLELRKWIVDINEEKPYKGFAFLTEDGPDNLVNVLLDKGYGKTVEILKTLKTRDDFNDAMSELGKKPNIKKSSKYLDPKELLSE